MSSFVLSHIEWKWSIRMKMLFLFVALLTLCSACIAADEIRENISLTEAESLFPAKICLPVYMPSGIDPTPSITYHADFGDPQDSDLRLRYYRSNDQVLMMEIYQIPWPGVSRQILNESEESRQLSIRDLTAWLVGWSKVEEAKTQIRTNATKYQDGTEHWLFEILEPTSLRANMIEWGQDSVYYRIFSRLSVEETKKTAQSLTNCTTSPKVTPSLK